MTMRQREPKGKYFRQLVSKEENKICNCPKKEEEKTTVSCHSPNCIMGTRKRRRDPFCIAAPPNSP
ncbi:hypothetical protein SS1G_00584 [Sclerotinia sclerotiorum 1980 UF-70]|uniref:Uncharacterized protein n=1 Tax=Sclerotinia sclerotiorum (strain ATCC 18683 / 1980 / Ss-1) TaxID=665079 RepID=A7E5K9_SCLS1|nr:hypothetical protein SS1G_00584 [Sclerotinia sclerotiorum 1980 UF-70]EDN91181.1 hypothetical protein SS1G_00584 [Sclerotinia sclerotiorum 1980 UF-70]